MQARGACNTRWAALTAAQPSVALAAFTNPNLGMQVMQAQVAQSEPAAGTRGRCLEPALLTPSHSATARRCRRPPHPNHLLHTRIPSCHILFPSPRSPSQ